LQAVESVTAATVYDQSGKVFATYRRSAGSSVPPHEHQLATVTTSARITCTCSSRSAGRRVASARSPVAPMPGYLQEIARHGPSAALFAVFGILAAWFLSFLVQRIISDPVLRLAHTARLISAEKNYAVRLSARAEMKLVCWLTLSTRCSSKSSGRTRS
jgi:hypothetical protein